MSCPNNNNNNQKRVQFSSKIDFISTFTRDEYDRSAEKVAKLNYNDMLELLTMRARWKDNMERMVEERTKANNSSPADIDEEDDQLKQNYSSIKVN